MLWWSMPEITRLSGSADWLDLDFVECKRTHEQAMKLGIPMLLAVLSVLNILLQIDGLSVQRSYKAVHDWVHKADYRQKYELGCS